MGVGRLPIDWSGESGSKAGRSFSWSLKPDLGSPAESGDIRDGLQQSTGRRNTCDFGKRFRILRI